MASQMKAFSGARLAKARNYLAKTHEICVLWVMNTYTALVDVYPEFDPD